MPIFLNILPLPFQENNFFMKFKSKLRGIALRASFLKYLVTFSRKLLIYYSSFHYYI